MSFKEFITEGRDAPLYHATSLIAAEAIITTEVFNTGRTLQPIPGRAIKDYTVSFTRSLKFAMEWYGAECVFVLNQSRLSADYKMIPSNFWAQARNKFQNRPQDVARPAPHHHPMTGNLVTPEFEELVAGPVRNAERYITKLIVLTKEYEKYIKLGDVTFYGQPKKYPLLWSNVDKKWINK